MRLWARVGIAVQFLALIRILAEYFRLRAVREGELALDEVDHWVRGALIAAVLCFLSVGLYFFGRFGAAAAVSALTLAALLAYRFLAME